MGDAIGQSLPLAIGVALSPIPIIAVVLMLTTPRASSNGLAFVLGWLLGLGALGAVVLAVADPAGASDEGEPATWVSWLKLVLGLLLLFLAIRQFRGRGDKGAGDGLPSWMTAIDRFGPARALGTAAALSALNPKNLLLGIAGATAIAQTGIAAGSQAVAYAVFAVVGSLGVGLPVLAYFVLGDRSARPLGNLKDWMSRNNTVIMAVLCVVIGVKLIGDAVTGLT